MPPAPQIQAEVAIRLFRRASFELFTGVPCSYLTPLINTVIDSSIDSSGVRYVGAANEGDAVAIAAGSVLGGKRAVVMFQNSGLGNAVNPLTSLTYTFRLPVLVITTWRGEPGGAPDEPQHEVMGAITPRLFELMRIPWETFPASAGELEAGLERATNQMHDRRLPYAFVVKKGTVASSAEGTRPTPAREVAGTVGGAFTGAAPLAADEALRGIVAGVGGSDVVLATTGFTGRALNALADRPNQLYMVGSMGCASSLALGLALAQPRRRVVVIDGDGAMLMRMGAAAIVGREHPENLVHVLLDNGVHDSTGSQATVSPAIDLALVAAACGYPDVRRIATATELTAAVRAARRGPTFLHVRTRPREDHALPRPSISPAEVAERFSAWMRANPA